MSDTPILLNLIPFPNPDGRPFFRVRARIGTPNLPMDTVQSYFRQMFGEALVTLQKFESLFSKLDRHPVGLAELNLKHLDLVGDLDLSM